jgi:hypothetical protein
MLDSTCARAGELHRQDRLTSFSNTVTAVPTDSARVIESHLGLPSRHSMRTPDKESNKVLAFHAHTLATKSSLEVFEEVRSKRGQQPTKRVKKQ